MYFFGYDFIDYGDFTYRNINQASFTETSLTGMAELQVDEEIRVRSAVLSGHAGITVDTLLKMFARVEMASQAEVVVNGVTAFIGMASLETSSSILIETVKAYIGRSVMKSRAKVDCATVLAFMGHSVMPSTAKLSCRSAKALLTGLADRQTAFFTMGNRCYMINGQDFIWTDGANSGHVRDIAYVPTLTLAGSADAPGAIYETLNYLSDSWIDSYSPDGEAVTFPVSFAPSDDVLVTAEEDTPEGVITYTEGVGLTVDRTVTHAKPFATVTFPVAPAKGTDTLRIRCTKTGMMDPGHILNCTLPVLYGGMADTRVHLAGHPEEPNIRYSSGLEDPTYWPEDAWEPIGADNEAITGFGKVADALFTFKERSRFYTWIEGPDDQGKITFPTLPVNDEYGCIAPRSVWPAQDGLLALAREGVTWSQPNTVRGQWNTWMVSKNINGKNGIGMGILDHSLEELKQAHAIVYEDKYLLHIGDRVYVLDLRYSSLPNIACWYPYDGIPGRAAQFMERGDELLLGDRFTGVIYRSTKRHLDDDQPIPAYWTSPLLFVGGRDWIKEFERLNLTFGGQPEGNHVLTVMTDQGWEEIGLILEAQGVFDYGSISYDTFSFGTLPYPSAQSEKIGYKGEYLQWQVGNAHPDQGISLLAQSLQYSLRKKVK